MSRTPGSPRRTATSCTAGTLRTKTRGPCCLFLHGNAGNITHRDDRLLTLRRLGFSVLMLDYRGYGRSEGSPSEKGVLLDARAARAWLAQRAGVAEQEIVLWGESLGGGVAVDLAAKDGARGLILESTFTSLPDMAAHHYRWLPGAVADAFAARFARARSAGTTARCCGATARPTRSSPTPTASGCSKPPTSPRKLSASPGLS